MPGLLPGHASPISPIRFFSLEKLLSSFSSRRMSPFFSFFSVQTYPKHRGKGPWREGLVAGGCHLPLCPHLHKAQTHDHLWLYCSHFTDAQKDSVTHLRSGG